MPTNILPLNSQVPTNDAVITKFFVTPIDHWVTLDGESRWSTESVECGSAH
ncbi:MAG: hypothetical protein MZW92_09290 [Comamonadaceae bacterium]|nr:hypothetical protein [Comamonadaceae bacterium]